MYPTSSSSSLQKKVALSAAPQEAPVPKDSIAATEVTQPRAAETQTAVACQSRRPAYDLSANLFHLYKTINLKYCTERRLFPVSQGDRFNNGFDDKDGYYVPIVGEEICHRYTVQEVIGQGSFGTVLRCCDEKYQATVAVKIYRRGAYFESQGVSEASICIRLNDNPALDNLVASFKKFFMWQNHLVLVFELLSYNLYQLIRRTQYNGVSLYLTRKFAFQIIDVLWQLEQYTPPIIHCDLKPENVMLRDSYRSGICVVDFGSATYLPMGDNYTPNTSLFTYSQLHLFLQQQTQNTSHNNSNNPHLIRFCPPMQKYVQSRFYRSPEVILELGYGTGIDRWSLGCMLVELHTGVPLFAGRNESDMLARFTAVLGPLPDEMISRSPKRDIFYSTNHSLNKLFLNSLSVSDNTSQAPSAIPCTVSSTNGPFSDEDRSIDVDAEHITRRPGTKNRKMDPNEPSIDKQHNSTDTNSNTMHSKNVKSQKQKNDFKTARTTTATATTIPVQPLVPMVSRRETCSVTSKCSQTRRSSKHPANRDCPQQQLFTASTPTATAFTPNSHQLKKQPSQKKSSHRSIPINASQSQSACPPPQVSSSNHDTHAFYSASQATRASPSTSGKVTYNLRHPLPQVTSLAAIIGVNTGGPRGCRAGQPGHDEETYRHFLDFVQQLLQYDPRKRLKCSEALRHPFLAPLHNITNPKPPK